MLTKRPVDALLLNLREPAVRHLAWACFSAPLVADFGPEIVAMAPVPEERDCQWLEQLDRNPSPLLSALSRCSSRRLGSYFEALWHFYIDQHPAFELLAHNLPIRDGKRTLGELDLLYRHICSGKVVHLELAVKYYLGVPSQTTDPDRHWYGPDPTDRFDQKLQHLCQHQSQLSQRSEVQARLHACGLPTVDARAIALKGFLFQPATMPLPLPAACADSANTGLWLYDHELTRQSLEGWHYFHVLQKRDWLMPGWSPSPDFESVEALMQALPRLQQQYHWPLQLVARRSLQQASNEGLRVFIMPAGWPDTKPKRAASA